MSDDVPIVERNYQPKYVIMYPPGWQPTRSPTSLMMHRQPETAVLAAVVRVAVIAVVIAAAEEVVVKEPRRAVIATKRGNPDTLRKEVVNRVVRCNTTNELI